MSEKLTNSNQAKLDALKKTKSTQTKREHTLSIKPPPGKSLKSVREEEASIQRLKSAAPAGRKKIPEKERRRHAVPVYLNDEELNYLQSLGSSYFLKEGKMLRLLIDQAGLLKH